MITMTMKDVLVDHTISSLTIGRSKIVYKPFSSDILFKIVNTSKIMLLFGGLHVNSIQNGCLA